MPASSIVSCPSCKSQLKLSLSAKQLYGKKIKCPKCATTFAVKVPAAKEPAAARKPTAGLSPTAAPASGVQKSQQGATSAKENSTRGQNKKKPVETAASLPKTHPQRKRRKKKKPKPVADEPLEWADDYADDQAESEFLDDYSLGDGDLYGDDLYGNDSAEDDLYSAPKPRRKKKKKKSAKSSRQQSSGESPNHGFLGWLGYGLGAGAICAGLTTVVGLLDVWALVVLMSIVTGVVVGGSVRYAAGYHQGWGPGIVAVVLALSSMFFGKVGALAVFPDLRSTWDIVPQTREEMEAEIAESTSEESMIADIADQVEADTNWLRQNNITDTVIENHWDTVPDDPSFEEQYLPAIWEEATRRWNSKSDEDKQALIDQLAADMRFDFGILTEDELEQKVNEQTTADRMIFDIAEYEVEQDEQWKSDNNITDERIGNQYNAATDPDRPEERFLPAVWEEASRRWAELSDEERQTRIATREQEIREQFDTSDEAIAEGKAAVGMFKLVVLVIGGLGAMFWPLGSLFCTGSGAMSAFKIGSGLASDE